MDDRGGPLNLKYWQWIQYSCHILDFSRHNVRGDFWAQLVDIRVVFQVHCSHVDDILQFSYFIILFIYY